MNFLDYVSFREFCTFFLVLARISSIFLFIPIYGGPLVPTYIKISLVLVLSVFFTSIYSKTLGINVENLPLSIFGYILLKEFVFGLTLAFFVNVFISITAIFGRIVSNLIGFSMVNLFDPTFGQVSPIEKFLIFYAYFLMMITGLHLYFFKILNDTFLYVPLGSVQLEPLLGKEIIVFFNKCFKLGFSLASPILIVILGIYVIFAILNRFAPQINIFFVGLPFNLMVGILLLILTFNIFSQSFFSWFKEFLIYLDKLILSLGK